MGRPKKEMRGKCRFCGVILNSINWLPSAQKQKRLICTSCNREKQGERQRRYIATSPDKYKAKTKRHTQRRVQVGNTWAVSSQPLKTGVCSNCGFIGETACHHLKYEPANLTAHTIELCEHCHGALHRSLQLQGKQIPGRELMGDYFGDAHDKEQPCT